MTRINLTVALDPLEFLEYEWNRVFLSSKLCGAGSYATKYRATIGFSPLPVAVQLIV